MAEPSGKYGTNAIPSSQQVSSTGCDERSTMLKAFCTQTMSVAARATANCSALTLLTPTPPIRPSMRMSTMAASWSSKATSDSDLYADDVGGCAGHGELLRTDVAHPDTPDQALDAHVDHGGQLVLQGDVGFFVHP